MRLVTCVILLGALTQCVVADETRQKPCRLTYNRPGAVSFLKTGLWANPLVMDWDDDGDLDIVSVCSDAPSHGAYLFINPTPKGEHEEMPIFRKPICVDGGQGSQIVVAQTVKEGVVVFNGSNATWDFRKTGYKGMKPIQVKGKPCKFMWGIFRLVDWDGDGRDDLVYGYDDWSKYNMFGGKSGYAADGSWTRGPLLTRLFWMRNLSGSGANANYDEPQPIPEPEGDTFTRMGRPCPMPADWDGDGDIDLILGDFRENFHYFENIGTRTQPKFASGKLVIADDGKPLAIEQCMMVPTAVDWNQDGKLDIVCGEEDGRTGFMRNTGRILNRVPVFEQPKHFRQEAHLLGCNVLATPSACDLDGDGDIDLVCGTSGGWIEFIENLSGPNVEFPSWAEPVRLLAGGELIHLQAGPSGSTQGPAESKFGYTNVSVVDWDGDGLLDILENSIWGEVHWYRNNGTKTRFSFETGRPIEVAWEGPAPVLNWGWNKPKGNALLTQWRTTPVGVDWNRDGLMDLVMLDTEGYLAYFERAKVNGKIILKSPKRIFCDKKGSPLRLNAGQVGASGRKKLTFCDWDGDGKLDLIVGGGHAMCMRQVSAEKGKVIFESAVKMADYNIAGHIAAPTEVDFNGDGIPDLLVGAEDGFFYYLRNPRKK